MPVAAVALISGLPLLWMGDGLDAAGLKYASKYWHVGPSVLFAVLVFTHSMQLWSTVRGHWHRLWRAGRRLQRESRAAQLAQSADCVALQLDATASGPKNSLTGFGTRAACKVSPLTSQDNEKNQMASASSQKIGPVASRPA